MFDEPRCCARERLGIAPRESGLPAARKSEEPPHHGENPFRLLRDRFDRAACTIVLLFGQELLGSPEDDAERRRDFMGDPGRQCAHRGELVCPDEPLVTLVADFSQGQLMTELELLALLAHGVTPEGENEA